MVSESRYISDIISVLLGKYETSKGFKTGVFTRRVLARSEDFSFYSELESFIGKQTFLSVLASLKKDGLIDYSFERFQEGNIVDSVWLVIDPDSISKCYGLIGRKCLSDIIDSLSKHIAEVLEFMDKGDIYCFINDYMDALKKDRKIRTPFTQDEQLNENLLKLLVFVSSNNKDISERMLSVHLYGDSKYYERNLKDILIRVLRKISPEDKTDEELLNERGIYRYPEELRFKGNIKAILVNGNTVDFSLFPHGAYLDSSFLKDVYKFQVEDSVILLVENKATYYDLIEKIPDNVLLIYHGGFLSPVKKLFLAKISETLDKSVFVYHWSDLDLGGFLIHVQIRDIFPDLIPFRMDKDTLLSNLDKGKEIKTDSYIDKLNLLLSNTSYKIFHEVIKVMISNRIKLEQESFA